MEFMKTRPNNINFDARFKLLLLLAMLYFTISLIGIPVTYKLISFGPIVGPGGLAVLPLIFLIEDIIVELYGYKVSRFILWLVLLSAVMFSVVVVGIVHLPSPEYWHSQDIYNKIFDPILKVGPASVIAIFSGRFINIILMTKWKILLKGKFFWFRSIASTLIGSSIALAIFFSLSFSGAFTFEQVERLFLSDLAIRVTYTVIGGLPASWFINYIKRKLSIDVYDTHIKFNPFSLDTSYSSTDKDK